MNVALLITLALLVYLLPIVVAYWRNHVQWGPITVVNIFLGWTFVGWVVALAWAFSANTRPDTDDDD